MVTFPRPCVALLLAACSVFAAPSVAAAAPGAGDDQYAPLPCTSAALDVDATGGGGAPTPAAGGPPPPPAPRPAGATRDARCRRSAPRPPRRVPAAPWRSSPAAPGAGSSTRGTSTTT